MQNKERLLELQSVFSRRHIGLLVAMLLFIANGLVINNGNAGLKYLPCVVICGVLLVDIFFAYFTFFHKYVLLMILRFAEMAIVGLSISDVGSNGVGGMSDVFAVLFYAMFMIETIYLFDLTDNGNKFKVSFIGQVSFVIKAIGVLFSGTDDYTTHCVYYVVLGIISFMITLAVSEFFGRMQKYYDQCIFSKDRMLDRAKDRSEEISEGQRIIREANEQLGIKKFELEEAYRRIKNVNADNDLQNRFMRLLLSPFDLHELMAKSKEIFRDSFKLEFSGLIFRNKKLREKYNSGIEEFFNNEEDLMQFMDFFLSDAFFYEHKEVGSHFIQDDISYDEFPFFSNKKISSVAVKAVVTDNSQHSCIYVMFSREYNLFSEKTILLDNIFGLIEVCARNLTLYYKVQEMSVRDALSGLYNRRYLNLYFNNNFVGKESACKRVALAMLDIDHFKNINDTYGHLFGDQAIKMVSELIIECAGKYDGNGFRYGGEEFVVIFENRTLAETVEIMNNLRESIKNTVISSEGQSINVKVSVGVAAYPETTDDMPGLVDRADKAMYYSKQNGRDRLTVDGAYGGEE